MDAAHTEVQSTGIRKAPNMAKFWETGNQVNARATAAEEAKRSTARADLALTGMLLRDKELTKDPGQILISRAADFLSGWTNAGLSDTDPRRTDKKKIAEVLIKTTNMVLDNPDGRIINVTDLERGLAVQEIVLLLVDGVCGQQTEERAIVDHLQMNVLRNEEMLINNDPVRRNRMDLINDQITETVRAAVENGAVSIPIENGISQLRVWIAGEKASLKQGVD